MGLEYRGSQVASSLHRTNNDNPYQNKGNRWTHISATAGVGVPAGWEPFHAQANGDLRRDRGRRVAASSFVPVRNRRTKLMLLLFGRKAIRESRTEPRGPRPGRVSYRASAPLILPSVVTKTCSY